MIELSVIIPCYNTRSELLERCIESVLQQQIDKYEIIIVDDGSDEEYKSEYKAIAEKSRKILVVTKENGGASSARNYGVMMSKGKYITFVDSDDELLSGSLAEGMKYAQQYNADLVIGANAIKDSDVIYKQKPNITCVVDDNPANKGSISKSYLAAHMLGRMIKYPEINGQIGRGPVSRIVKAEFAKGTPFDTKMVIGEDVKWNLELIENCKNIILVEQVWYKYYLNNISVTHRYRDNAIEIADVELEQLRLYADMNDDVQFESYCVRIIQALERISDTYISHPNNKMGITQRRECIRYLYNQYPWKMVGEDRFYNLTEGTYKIKARLYRFHMFFGIRMLKKRFERSKQILKG